MSAQEKPTGWWRSFPVVLGGIAGLLTAITGLIVALHQIGCFEKQRAPEPAPPKPIIHIIDPVPPRPSENTISNFKAKDISDTALEVSVDYSYDGKHGTGIQHVYMSAVAIQRERAGVPGTKFRWSGGTGEVKPGKGTIKMLITKLTEGHFESKSVEVCIMARDESGKIQKVFCTNFPHMKIWK